MSRKKSILRALDCVGMLCGIGGRRYMRRGLTILMYHRVLPAERCADYPLSSLVIPESVFVDQVDWLAKYCCVMTLEQAVHLNHSPGDRPVVALTFDDGYHDNLDAAEILNQMGLKATFFIATDLIEGKTMWYDIASVGWVQLGRAGITAMIGDQIPKHVDSIRAWMSFLKQMNHHRRLGVMDCLRRAVDVANDYRGLTSDQVRQISDAGHEVGCHTMSHPRLEQLDEAGLHTEIVVARSKIESICRKSVTGFCYPDGSLDDRAVAMVQRAGYAYACTTKVGLNTERTDRHRLMRFDVTTDRTTSDGCHHDPLLFEAEISGFHQMLRR